MKNQNQNWNLNQDENENQVSSEARRLEELRKISSETLHAELVRETTFEREQLAKIVCYIYEVDRRKLFLKYGHASMFDYLVKEMKYSNASAARRLDAARLLSAAPEVAQNLATGELTLTQVSVVAQGLKQAKRESSDFSSTVQMKRDLLASVKSQSTSVAQHTVAQALNLEIKAVEKKVIQKDESLRLEIMFSKDEAELLKEVKDLLSHTMPGASYREVLVAALKEVKLRKDPKRKRRVATPAAKATSVAKAISTAEVRRSIFRRDGSCQWRHSTGEVCGSTFQLQLDHKKSQWLGGSNDEENLQVLCSVHNRLKYQHEIEMN